jgi:hypothetical protein
MCEEVWPRNVSAEDMPSEPEGKVDEGQEVGDKPKEIMRVDLERGTADQQKYLAWLEGLSMMQSTGCNFQGSVHVGGPRGELAGYQRHKKYICPYKRKEHHHRQHQQRRKEQHLYNAQPFNPVQAFLQFDALRRYVAARIKKMPLTIRWVLISQPQTC